MWKKVYVSHREGVGRKHQKERERQRVIESNERKRGRVIETIRVSICV